LNQKLKSYIKGLWINARNNRVERGRETGTRKFRGREVYGKLEKRGRDARLPLVREQHEIGKKFET